MTNPIPQPIPQTRRTLPLCLDRGALNDILSLSKVGAESLISRRDIVAASYARWSHDLTLVQMVIAGSRRVWIRPLLSADVSARARRVLILSPVRAIVARNRRHVWIRPLVPGIVVRRNVRIDPLVAACVRRVWTLPLGSAVVARSGSRSRRCVASIVSPASRWCSIVVVVVPVARAPRWWRRGERGVVAVVIAVVMIARCPGRRRRS
jgi:hypothetical protein